jgi:GT2 family glycosyltransferase
MSPLRRPFTRSLSIPGPDPHVQTANVFYPREVLERVGGLDVDGFARYAGDDADFAWRAIGAGAEVVFEPGALVEHAYLYLGPVGKLRYAAGWDFKVYALHPGLRRAYFTRRWFWKGSHYLLARALVAAALPRRWRPVKAWLAVPYAVHLVERGRDEGGGPLLAPYYLANDLVELGASIRSTVRYRVPML